VRHGGAFRGESPAELLERLAPRLLEEGFTVAAAESCTGGLISHILTNYPGSSGYFRGGIVAYSNEMKIDLLGVPGDMIQKHGAVSPEVAGAMAEGIRLALGADLCLGVTGIAGPGGSTPGKPVGLVYIALATVNTGEIITIVKEFMFTGDRLENKKSTAAAALKLLLERT